MGVYFRQNYQRQPGANTVAYRPLTADTTVNDMSGNNYTLTQTGGSFGIYDGVDCFYNGGDTTGYFDLTSAPLIPSVNADRTISLWGKVSEYSTSNQRLFISYGTVSEQGKGVLIGTSTNGNYGGGAWTSQFLSGGAINSGAWCLLTLVMGGSETKFYVNGELKAAQTVTLNTPAISSSKPLRIMRKNDTLSSSFQIRGYISDVIIEDKIWTAEEIVEYYNGMKYYYGLT